MAERIIFIKGAAYPKTQGKVIQEMVRSQDYAGRLEKSGHSVKTIGVSWRGFYMHHLEKHFCAPDANYIFVNVHGNAEDDKHRLAIRHEESSHLWAHEFYAGLAQVADNRPLNIFMVSCGSGSGCLDAVEHLPKGSTLFNLSRAKDPLDFMPNLEAFDLAPDPCKPFGERLMLNILAKGYKGMSIYPQLSISTGQRDVGNIWDLWDITRMETLMEGSKFQPAFVEAAKDYLRGYFPQESILKALWTIEHYTDVQIEHGQTRYENEKTPVKIGMQIDENGYLAQVRNAGLFEVACAIGYYANRQLIGAFQTGEIRAVPQMAPV